MDSRDGNESGAVQPSSAQTGNYEVGYCKPPVHTQFKKGGSGNPSGRPKKRRTFVDCFTKALSRKQAVDLDGKAVMMEMRQIGAHNWAKKFAKGDPEVLRVGMQLDPHFATKAEERVQELWFTLKLEENEPRPHWQLIEDGEVIDQG